MILNSKPLSMGEATEYVSKENVQIHNYFKSFVKNDAKRAEKIRELLSGLNNLKIKESHIVKVIDLAPQDLEDIHKIFNDVSLSEEEATAILNVLQK